MWHKLYVINVKRETAAWLRLLSEHLIQYHKVTTRGHLWLGSRLKARLVALASKNAKPRNSMRVYGYYLIG